MTMKKNFIKIFILSCFALVLFGCGQEFDINQFKTTENTGNVTGDTVYIQLSPVWEGFNKPTAIMVGREPFIYVCDTGNDRIVMLDVSGKVIGFRSIKQPVAIAQDYKLNLIICAKFDTTISGQVKTFSAVYKINMFAGNHNIASAPMKMVLPGLAELSKPTREYTGVCVFYDNSYYISRKGPNNSSFIDPDNSILVFDGNDVANGRVPLLEPVGTGLVSAYNINSLTSFNKKNIDFIATYNSNNSFKVQWLNYVSTTEKSGYESRLSPASAPMMLPNRFGQPYGATVDNSGNIYVADAVKDSIFKFSASGEELQSFGGPNVFNAPHGVAFFDKTLYVTDTENNRVLRFVLSTDIR